MNKILSLVLILMFMHPLQGTELLERDRSSELQEEYRKGKMEGSFGKFVAEMKDKLIQTTNLKEATRLATLIRAYIHGQIIGFDTGKKLTEDDRMHVLQAHATVTAFFSLSPLGTDRYREDTLKYVQNTVSGSYARSLATVADAVQLALWNPAASPEQIRHHAFLQLIFPYYLKGGECDLTTSLGQPTDDGANEHVVSLLSDNLINDISSLTRRVMGSSAPVFKAQQEQMAKVFEAIPVDSASPPKFLEKDEKFIWSVHDGQCGWYSVLPPWLRYKDKNGVLPFNRTSQYVDLFEKYDSRRTKQPHKKIYDDVRRMGLDTYKDGGNRPTWFNGAPDQIHLLLSYACYVQITALSNYNGTHKRFNEELSEEYKGLLQPPMQTLISVRPAYIDPIVKCGGLDSINLATRLRHPVRSNDAWDLRTSAASCKWQYPTNQTGYQAWLTAYGLAQ